MQDYILLNLAESLSLKVTRLSQRPQEFGVPPPEGIVAFVLGNADLNLKEIPVLFRVIDGDCQDELQVLACGMDL